MFYDVLFSIQTTQLFFLAFMHVSSENLSIKRQNLLKQMTINLLLHKHCQRNVREGIENCQTKRTCAMQLFLAR